MDDNYEKMLAVWPTIAPVLSLPENDDELDRLLRFSDYLMDHPDDTNRDARLSLLAIVGLIIECYENEKRAHH